MAGSKSTAISRYGVALEGYVWTFSLKVAQKKKGFLSVLEQA